MCCGCTYVIHHHLLFLFVHGITWPALNMEHCQIDRRFHLSWSVSWSLVPPAGSYVSFQTWKLSWVQQHLPRSVNEESSLEIRCSTTWTVSGCVANTLYLKSDFQDHQTEYVRWRSNEWPSELVGQCYKQREIHRKVYCTSPTPEYPKLALLVWENAEEL